MLTKLTDKLKTMMEDKINSALQDAERKRVESSQPEHQQYSDEEYEEEEVIHEEEEEDEIMLDEEITTANYVNTDAFEHRIVKRLDELQETVIELCKSHDSLVTNIQTSIIESMQVVQAAKKTGRKKAPTKYTVKQEDAYAGILKLFCDKTGKQQRDLTNGVNQLISSKHDYIVGKPAGCAPSEHILQKVSKDYELDNEKYLSIDDYIDTVTSYVSFITQTSVDELLEALHNSQSDTPEEAESSTE